jgi:hypothetical protein
MKLEARLRAFAALARLRSFSGAARELRISQPAVSKHIADIEREFGAPLADAEYDRNSRCRAFVPRHPLSAIKSLLISLTISPAACLPSAPGDAKYLLTPYAQCSRPDILRSDSHPALRNQPPRNSNSSEHSMHLGSRPFPTPRR